MLVGWNIKSRIIEKGFRTRTHTCAPLMMECVDHISIRQCLIDYNEPLSSTHAQRIHSVMCERTYLGTRAPPAITNDFMPNYTYLSVVVRLLLPYFVVFGVSINTPLVSQIIKNNNNAVAGGDNVMARGTNINIDPRANEIFFLSIYPSI